MITYSRKYIQVVGCLVSFALCGNASAAIAGSELDGKVSIAPMQGLEIFKSFCFNSAGAKSSFKKTLKANPVFSNARKTEFTKVYTLHKTNAILAQISKDNICSVVFISKQTSDKSVAKIKAALPSKLGIKSTGIKFTRQRTDFKTAKGTVSVTNYDMFIGDAVALSFFK